MDIRKYEKTERFTLEDDRGEAERLLKSLLDIKNLLREIDTDGLEPFVTPLTLWNQMREDAAEQIFTREEMFRCAPVHNGEYYEVPGVLTGCRNET